MKGRVMDQRQVSMFSQELKELIDPKHPLCRLSSQMPWGEIDRGFDGYYHYTGRPAKPVRLMVSLLILKQVYDLSDEEVTQRWVENPYYQFFSGESVFQWKLPVHPTDLVYFRKRIGEEGVKKILQISIDLHGRKAEEKEVVVDTTVQEKNITFPTDVKLYRKIIDNCVRIAEEKDIVLRQSYKRTVKKLLLVQRFRNHHKNKKKAVAAQRKLKTIAGRLVRELYRKLPDPGEYEERLVLFDKILSQERDSQDKVYSMSRRCTV